MSCSFTYLGSRPTGQSISRAMIYEDSAKALELTVVRRRLYILCWRIKPFSLGLRQRNTLPSAQPNGRTYRFVKEQVCLVAMRVPSLCSRQLKTERHLRGHRATFIGRTYGERGLLYSIKIDVLTRDARDFGQVKLQQTSEEERERAHHGRSIQFVTAYLWFNCTCGLLPYHHCVPCIWTEHM